MIREESEKDLELEDEQVEQQTMLKKKFSDSNLPPATASKILENEAAEAKINSQTLLLKTLICFLF